MSSCFKIEIVFRLKRQLVLYSKKKTLGIFFCLGFFVRRVSPRVPSIPYVPTRLVFVFGWGSTTTSPLRVLVSACVWL